MRALGVRWLLCAVLIGCGGPFPPIRIDDVSLVPEDIPLNSGSAEPIRIAATVTGHVQEIAEVWVDCEEAPLRMEMMRTGDTRWTAAVPVRALQGFPAGRYRLDLHARDAAAREATLDDAVVLRITPE